MCLRLYARATRSAGPLLKSLVQRRKYCHHAVSRPWRRVFFGSTQTGLIGGLIAWNFRHFSFWCPLVPLQVIYETLSRNTRTRIQFACQCPSFQVVARSYSIFFKISIVNVGFFALLILTFDVRRYAGAKTLDASILKPIVPVFNFHTYVY